ncbi:MAG: phosphatidate cytidylyltransferase [Ignavibacteria bacterium]|nr:phosphatidate cytidylyltransferase [Ignavibacteria bacterium]
MNNLAKRTLISIISIPIILGLAFLGDIYFLILCFILQFFCLLEFYNLFERSGFKPFKYLSIIFSLLLFLIKHLDIPYFFFISFLFLFLIVTLEIFKGNKSNPINVFLTIGGILYITIPFILLSELSSNFTYKMVFILFIVIWSSDTMAYFIGKYLGKHKLTKISPNKTIEGTISGFIAALISAIILSRIYFDVITTYDAFIIGIIVGVFGVVGDIFESLIKRFSEVKDSSTIIPGHGGMLDRFDSLIFVTPIIYIYFHYLR